MDFSRPIYQGFRIGVQLISAFLLAASASHAQEFRLDSAGARYGFPTDGRSEGFNQAEAFVNWNLPWRWQLGRTWPLQSRLDFSAGWLGRERADAFVTTLGPTLVLGHEGLPLSLEGGVSVTGISRDQFGSKDLGSLFQFTSHVGLNWDFAPHLRLGYRFQHMSNAGIREPNPGLNLHMVAISYLF